jgi:long-chain acyl-CoA synthetase
MFLHRIAATPDLVAFEYPDGSAWKALTWREVGARVRACASGLRALGLTDEARVAILSSTRIEWQLADLGILLAGGATSTIYPSNTSSECAYILNDSAATFVFAENDAQLRKLVEKRPELPNLKNVILFDGEGDGVWSISMARLEQLGREHDQKNPDDYERIARAVKPESLATLIYTSGTTGQPKGVELTHDCWLYEGWAIEEMKLIGPDDKQYLWLPLSHVFGKVFQAAQLQIGFTTAIDGRIDKLVDNLAVVKPTFVGAVPRIFEKVHNKVVMGAKEGGALKAKIFTWAFTVGRQVSKLRQEGKSPTGLLAIQNAIADRLVFSKLKQRFGGRMKFFVSGSAPLARDIAEFFHAAGILIAEGYGLTESSAASFVNRPGKFKFGTVGLPLPGTEVKIAESDGEILLRGRGIMRGYYKKPAETAESLDGDGWLHTGDIGMIDPDGFLRITDRKKDLIKTSGGKYVAPQLLEGKLKSMCPYVSQVVVHGNNRNFVSALVTLDEEAMKKWAGEHALGDKKLAELAQRPEVRALVQGFVDQLNSGLASYETIKKFAILGADLTTENGDLTASLKVKRKVVEQKYKDVLDGFYAGAMAEM